jgi:hypothetical protein
MTDNTSTVLKILYVDPETHKRIKWAATFEGVTMQEMMRRIAAQVPVIGKIEDGRVILKG